MGIKNIPNSLPSRQFDFFGLFPTRIRFILGASFTIFFLDLIQCGVQRGLSSGGDVSHHSGFGRVDVFHEVYIVAGFVLDCKVVSVTWLRDSCNFLKDYILAFYIYTEA